MHINEQAWTADDIATCNFQVTLPFPNSNIQLNDERGLNRMAVIGWFLQLAPSQQYPLDRSELGRGERWIALDSTLPQPRRKK